ncbi:hypothetical protein DVS77_05935 [Mycolicibacterium moriokaense]|nr:hypothetical protein DVS77_05935 [Mycolicibacterium moriokaense]
MSQPDQGDWSGGFWSVELTPIEEGILEWDRPFKVFQVDVESNTEIGRALHNDPLTVLRARVPEMDLPEGTQAQVLRVNAERPANPRKRREVWIVYEGSFAVGVQYKYLPGE